MPRTIGNPLSWSAGVIGSMFGYLASVTEAVGPATTAAPPTVRRITTADLARALRKGAQDMGTFRTDVIFVCLLYPIIGVGLVALALRGDAVHLLFPVMSGFALVGPVAAVGLYEMSRCREKGIATSWLAYIDVLKSPKFGGIVVLALFHMVIFLLWVMCANLIFALTIGPDTPASFSAFVAEVTGTTAGWVMIVAGMAVGFGFAVVVLAMSVVSFPLLLDRDVGVAVAVVTSVRVALANPVPVTVWGLIVAGALFLGTLPALLGLVLVMPLLGHATWHLYRAAVV